MGDLLAARQNLEAARATWVQHGGPSADPFEFRSIVALLGNHLSETEARTPPLPNMAAS